MVKYKPTRIVDRITAEEFLDIVNDPLFVGGLQACINHTAKSGYETRFHVDRSPSQNQTYFPENIEVGNNVSVGNKERDEILYEEFRKIYGDAPSYFGSNISNDKPSPNQILKLHKDREKYFEAFHKFVAERGEEVKLDFPNLPRERHHFNSLYFPDSYEFLGVHTHPLRPLKLFGRVVRLLSHPFPSEGDLGHVWYRKMKAQTIPVSGEIDYSKPSIVVNPFEIITSINQSEINGTYDLSLVGCHNINVAPGFKDLKEQIEAESRTINTNDLCDFRKLKLYFSDFFSFTKGIFNPQTGKVQFDPAVLDAMLEVN